MRSVCGPLVRTSSVEAEGYFRDDSIAFRLVLHVSANGLKWEAMALRYDRRKISLIEGNAKCCHLKNILKLTCKGTLQQVFYLSEAKNPMHCSHPNTP